MCCYIAVWNAKYCFLLKMVTCYNNQLGHYASLTDHSQTDFAYLTLDYIELELQSKE